VCAAPTPQQVVIPRACGGSSTPRPLGSIANASGILDHPLSRMMTVGDRHCERERSNPLRGKKRKLDCFVAIAPRNDVEIRVRILAAHCARGLPEIPYPLKAEGLPLSPCGRGWTRCAASRTGEGFFPRIETPHPAAFGCHLLPQGEKGRRQIKAWSTPASTASSRRPASASSSGCAGWWSSSCRRQPTRFRRPSESARSRHRRRRE